MIKKTYLGIAKSFAALIWPGVLSGSLSLLGGLTGVNNATASESYFSYLGGALTDSAYAITSDSQNNIYITGVTNSESFDGFDPLTTRIHKNRNCFVTRINLTNSALNYYFEFAGSKSETCRAIAVDSASNVYVTGETESSDLPVTTNNSFGGIWDAFVFKLNSYGELVYASYLGGSLTDYGHGLALRDIDNVFIAGETWSNNFPTTNNAYIADCKTLNICDGLKANAFVTHINTSNPSQFISEYSTYLGGKDQDKAHSINIDSTGILHIAGETSSTDFPLVNYISDHLKGTFDGFVSHINPALNPAISAAQSLIFSSYIGGNGDDFITAITSDTNGSSYITGGTSSDDFPTSLNAFSQRCANGKINCQAVNPKQQHSDIFISKITGNRMVYSTLLGGSKSESAQAILVDNQGLIYVAGFTLSDDFPLTDNAMNNTINKDCNTPSSCGSNSDGFLVKIDPSIDNKSGLQFSTYLGGDKEDNIRGLHSLIDGAMLITGETSSAEIASATAIDSLQQNSEAFIQIIEIDSIGNWIDDTVVISNKAKTAASATSPLYLLLLIFLGLSRINKTDIA